MAGLLLNSWSPAQQDEPKLSTIKIQMLRLSKPVPETKPVEPVPMAIPEPVQPVFEPTPVAPKKPEPKPVVENELTFKRVEEKKPTPKKEVKPKLEKPEKKVVEKVVKQLEKRVSQPAETLPKPALAQQSKPINTAAKTPVKQYDSLNDDASETFSVERYKPIEKQAPEYPRGALRKGLEGDCTVRYTVNTKGDVESPEVLANCHPLFKKPSLEAAKTFRYSPRMVNGHAVAVNNVHNTFEYRIH
ncbi:hypothetical protein Q7A_2165 [Methylophaga nitratireducenticrescens]|nr:hypothetical protein Q7A_2165 [Methylophaga nitratireducenticrescens]AUZ86058.1 hypothetical protein CDW43_10555 [Methylophaga nitratireducenticrescens]